MLGALLSSSTLRGDNPAGTTLTIESDALLALSNGPHSAREISRDRYFRLYHFPGMYKGEVSALLRELRVAPGRGTGPYFGDDGGDKLRFGRAETEKATIEEFVNMAARAAIEHPGAPYAAAGGSFPDFPSDPTSSDAAAGSVEPTMKVGHSRAVAPRDWPEASGLLARWLQKMKQSGVALPSFFSPVNEPDASWKAGPGSAGEHADFVREVALSLRESAPEVRVSGPCTAWPYPGADWKRWEPGGWERIFIETAGDVVGGYDFHLYTKELWAYGPESPGFDPARKMPTPNLFQSLSLGHPEIMEFGKSEVLLDLVQSLHQARCPGRTGNKTHAACRLHGILPRI